MSLFRPTANHLGRTLGGLVALCLAALVLFSAQAVAHGWHRGHWGPPRPAPEQVNEELAVCEGQTFYQPFLAYADENYYTLVEGSEFDEGREGWSLRGGAEIEADQRPDGGSGGVLDLPPGSVAVSPPVCVTLQYPTARTWVQTLDGNDGLLAGVFYAGSGNGPAAADWVARLGSDEGEWALSDPFEVKPELGGAAEGTREVRFVFANWTWHSHFQLHGVFVDPRMR